MTGAAVGQLTGAADFTAAAMQAPGGVEPNDRSAGGRLGTVLVCTEAETCGGGLIAQALTSRHWAVTATSDAERALWLASVRTFGAIVIAGQTEPWTMGALSSLRASGPSPILVFADGGAERHGALFELGADMVADSHPCDDWVAAAVSALVRRSGSMAPMLRYLECDDLTLDVRSRHATVDGSQVDLSPIEFALLQVLMTHPELAVRHQTIIKLVWNWKYGDDRNALRIQVNRLRKKLNDTSRQPRFIRSLRGYGYSFVRPVSQLADDFTRIGGNSEPDRIDALGNELRLLGRLLVAAPDAELAADLLVKAVVERDVCDAAAVMMRDPGDKLALTAHAGMPDSWVGAVEGGIPLERSFISADTVLSGRPSYFVDVTSAPQRFRSSAKLLKAAEMPVFLSIPLANRKGVWGHIGYSARADRSFTRAHVMLLEGAGLVLGALKPALGRS
jgi:two-component system KDP operon response regulator KdpE